MAEPRLRFRARWQIALRYAPFHPAEKLVLYVLSTYMTADGEGAAPSYQTLADGAGVSRQWAVKAIKKAEPHWLSRRSRQAQRRPAIYIPRIPDDIELLIEGVLSARHGQLSCPSPREDMGNSVTATWATQSPDMGNSVGHEPIEPIYKSPEDVDELAPAGLVDAPWLNVGKSWLEWAHMSEAERQQATDDAQEAT